MGACMWGLIPEPLELYFVWVGEGGGGGGWLTTLEIPPLFQAPILHVCEAVGKSSEKADPGFLLVEI